MIIKKSNIFFGLIEEINNNNTTLRAKLQKPPQSNLDLFYIYVEQGDIN